jgi:hypothetical protein
LSSWDFHLKLPQTREHRRVKRLRPKDEVHLKINVLGKDDVKRKGGKRDSDSVA